MINDYKSYSKSKKTPLICPLNTLEKLEIDQKEMNIIDYSCKVISNKLEINILHLFFKHLRNELQFKMNSWNIISILVLITIFTPIFLILYNFNINAENWVHIKNNLLGKYIFSTVYIILGVGFVSSIIGVGSACL